MAALVCDICGGKLVMGAGSIAVCDSCGMEHSKDRMQEKIQEVKGTVRVDNSHMIDNWMEMGITAYNSGNNEEAYNYFAKIVEIDLENWKAIFYKGMAAGYQTTLLKPRIAEATDGLERSLDIITSIHSMDDAAKADLILELVSAYDRLVDAYYELAYDRYYQQDKIYDNTTDVFMDALGVAGECIILHKLALSLISSYSSETKNAFQIDIMKNTCKCCYFACSSIMYWFDYSETSSAYLGLNVDMKQNFIDTYDEIVYEIRKTEPDYRKNEMYAIDRLDPPSFNSTRNLTYTNNRNRELQRKKDLEMDSRWKKEQQEIYWKEHPEEYQAYIDEQEKKREKEKIRQEQLRLKREQLKRELDEKQSEFNIYTNEQDEKIARLKQERSSLGIFAGKRKKELDNSISKIESDIASYKISCGLSDALKEYQNA